MEEEHIAVLSGMSYDTYEIRTSIDKNKDYIDNNGSSLGDKWILQIR